MHTAQGTWEVLAPLGTGQRDLPGCDQGPGPTCADEHDVVDSPVQGLGPVHHDLGVVHTAFDQPGPVACRGHRVVHQRVVFDELQRLVGQTERAGEVGGPRLAVDALQGADRPLPVTHGRRAPHKAGPGRRKTRDSTGGFLKKGNQDGPPLNLKTVVARRSATVLLPTRYNYIS